MKCQRTPTSPRVQRATILDAMRDPALFGAWFTPVDSWQRWMVLLKALFGLGLSDGEATVFRRYTERTTPPSEPAREAWLVGGRRSGKSLIAALVAVFLACFRGHVTTLAPGERGTVMVIAADRRQARVVLRYISGLIDAIPMLARMVEGRTQEAIHLTNRVSIEVHTASFRAVRGYTIIAAICDEIAFWRNEDSTNPDTEILNGLRPGMATVPGALLLCISSPYARKGALWDTHKAHYGRDGDPVLVWQADTYSMNPTVDERIIRAAYEQDPAAAAAEYGAEFRRDIESFLNREAIEGCVVPNRRELLPISGCRYLAFVDPSGGSQDAMTLVVAHLEERRVVLDLIRERRPPFSPEALVQEFTEILRRYHITTVVGDRFGGEWPRERFRNQGITYNIADKSKSELYRELLPLINSGRVELLDHPRLIAQLCSLERRTARGGRDSIDHGSGGHDDIANAAAGAAVTATRSNNLQIYGFINGIPVGEIGKMSPEERAIHGLDHYRWHRW